MAFVYTRSLQVWLGSENEGHDRKLKWVVGRQTPLLWHQAQPSRTGELTVGQLTTSSRSATVAD